MAMSENTLLAMTAQIVSAHLSNTSVPTRDLAGLIDEVFCKLRDRAGEERGISAEPRAARAVKADASSTAQESTDRMTSWEATVSPNALISLIDGKPYKTLKRHLARHGLTPEAYRKRFDLPLTYPMVAPALAEARSRLAKERGLGQARQTTVRASAKTRSRKTQRPN